MELNPLIQNSVQQDCLPELYPLYSPYLPKMPPLLMLLCCPARYGLPPSLEPLRETLPLNSQKSTHFSPPEKSTLAEFTSSSTKSIILSPSCSNFHVITPYQFELQLYNCCCIIVLILGFMYTHVMLILINRCLLNVVFSMTKV